MAFESPIFDFFEKVAIGFGATLAILAVVGLSIPSKVVCYRRARRAQQDPQ